MTTLRQAAEQALEALKLIDNAMPFPVAKLTIKHLQEVLAEESAQQEPVAYLCENAVGHKYFRWKKPSSTYKPIALYTSPPAQRTWVGLMDEEILQTLDLVAYDTQAFDFAYRIEAKLKEKNT